jgi:hypothetical protein
MNRQTDNPKLTVKHLHRSEDKYTRQINLNNLMEKVIIRHLKSGKAA